MKILSIDRGMACEDIAGRNLKRKVVFLSVLLLVLFTVAFMPVEASAKSKKLKGKELKALQDIRVVIETSKGEIELKFFPELAPGHVKNFLKLTRENFYNNTLFHRVIPGFMIQGGDPNTTGPNKRSYGTGGPGYSIDAEFSDKKHSRGILSMARSQDPNSAGSQFFIVVADSNFLDGKYTVFGEVTKGMDVVDKIVNLPRNRRDLPNERVWMNIKVLDK